MKTVNEASVRSLMQVDGVSEDAARARLAAVAQEENDRRTQMRQHQAAMQQRADAEREQLAQWRAAAMNAAIAEADPAGELRAAFDRTGAAWRELLEQREAHAEALTRVRAERPTSDAGIDKQIRAERKLAYAIEALDTQIPEAQALHHQAQAALAGAFTATLRERERTSERRIAEIHERYQQDTAAARYDAGQWSWLARQAERGNVAELLAEV